MTRRLFRRSAWLLVANLVGCGGGSDGTAASTGTTPATATTRSFKVQVWADNWFSLHVGETYVGEDSVSITTDRIDCVATKSASA